MSAIRKAAKGEDCTLNIAGVCNYNPETGIPVRVTVSEMGPMLLARLMNLNDTQEGLLNLVFKVADDRGWHILDLKDLRSNTVSCSKNDNA